MGGATFAAGLAPSGARIVILERGEVLPDSPDARDARAIFQRGVYRPQEIVDRRRRRAVQSRQLLLCRRQHEVLRRGADSLSRPGFRARSNLRKARRRAGRSPTRSWSRGTARAEALYQVRGAVGDDPTEPAHSAPYPHPPVPDEPAIAEVRERLKRVGLHPFSLPLGVDIEAWLKRAPTPWDAFPDTRSGKMDAETCGLKAALAHPNVELRDRRAGEARAARSRTASAFAASSTHEDGETRDADRQARRAVRRRRQFGGRCCCIARGRPRQSLRRGRPSFHEPQFVGGARDRSAHGQRLGLSEDARAQRFLSRRRTRRAAARQRSAARPRHRPDPESQHRERAGMGAECAEPAQRRLVCDERGSAEPGEPRDGRRRTHPARLEAQQLERASRTGRAAARAPEAPPAIRSCSSQRVRSPHAVASVRHGPHRRDPALRRSIPIAAPGTIPICSSSTASFLPTSAAVNPALTIAAQALRVADHIAKTDL